MSETPRTDEASFVCEEGTVASVYFAETLERELAAVSRERNELLRANSRWSEIVADELAESRRLMDLGGAKDDENFTTFAERVIAERDALRAEVERIRKVVDLYFMPWGAAKAAMWEGTVGDVGFTAGNAMRALQAALTPAEVTK